MTHQITQALEALKECELFLRTIGLDSEPAAKVAASAREAIATLESGALSAAESVGMTEAQAIAHARTFARNCNVLEHAAHKYLQNVDTKWLPHEWVVRAIIAASNGQVQQ